MRIKPANYGTQLREIMKDPKIRMKMDECNEMLRFELDPISLDKYSKDEIEKINLDKFEFEK